MKLKKRMILFGTACILNTMAVGCGSAIESTVKTEEAQSGEILPEEETGTPFHGECPDTGRIFHGGCSGSRRRTPDCRGR